jgi:hypothetical protein
MWVECLYRRLLRSWRGVSGRPLFQRLAVGGRSMGCMGENRFVLCHRAQQSSLLDNKVSTLI